MLSHATRGRGGRPGAVDPTAGRRLWGLGAAGLSLAGQLIGELVAPSRCAACDEPVRPSVLFCASCSVSAIDSEDTHEGSHAVFAYGGAVATAIVRLKYAGRPDLATRLAPLLAAAGARRFQGAVDVVVPVPLHPQRLVERGFDQAALLASPVARRLGIPCLPRVLVRLRATPRQASLDRSERGANVAAAFASRSPRAIAGQRVLLVDDVRTTGATLASCDAVLRASGAAEVVSLVLASRDWRETQAKAEANED